MTTCNNTIGFFYNNVLRLYTVDRNTCLTDRLHTPQTIQNQILQIKQYPDSLY